MFTKSGQLTYCSNIHAGEDWVDHFKALDINFPAIKAAVSPDQPMGLGLRLSHLASLELLKAENLMAFEQWLKKNDAYVFTMNGFPYGGFHRTKVKDQVHAPDWTTTERVDYTLRLFDILSKLLPEGMDGGVSTSPLSYRHWFNGEEKLAAAKQTATENIVKIAEQLISIQQTTGKLLHLDIEPEPDGVLENGKEFIDWFQNLLVPSGSEIIARKCGVSEKKAGELIKTHIRICYDVCHFAIGYEPHAAMIQKLDKAGILIGKFQISAALKASLPEDETNRQDIKKAFTIFDEPTYLHQVVARTGTKELLRYRDLPQALDDVKNSAVKEWRAHFHVPVFEKNFGLLESTQDEIVEVLKIQKKKALTQHLEVETYTWEVLAEKSKLPIQQSIIRELNWVKEQL